MLVLTLAVATFATMFFFLLALQGTEVTARARLEGFREQPRQQEEGAERLTVSQRLVAPMTETLVRQMRRVLPTGILRGIEKKLVLAGEPMTVNGFLMFHLIITGVFVLLSVLIVVGAGLGLDLTGLMLIGVLSFVGILLPQMWLRQRAGQRQHQVVKSLPDAFDLITICAEAGLGLDAALARVAEKVEGPFSDELRRSLREIALGKMRKDALRELGERTGVPDLIAFVNAVIQAEQMGSSIGTVLRVQAEQLRVRRRQRAEEQAYKAPIKMLFPLVFCIFPSLFIVILGPAVITIMRDFPS